MGYKQFDEAAIFNAARKIAEPESRAGYLKQACGENPALLERVGALLRAHDEEKSFLESPPSVFVATADTSTIREGPGTVIGPYKLHEQIGEGGFGVVYLAEQQKPVRRRVALKIIKPGMDSKQVIARFEAERQALALMDHANIARVLDAGATESGRPYFVMELVKGIPITDYCDQCNLTTRERLGLFVSVCHAIQHAHQKGIIHRDVKPTNVMMAMQNEEATPKVIDFGVAKAINQRLTEHTVYTQFAQMVGTPMYMSPEQAEMSPIEVDTRTDIYSLGVLLYELLVGATPFDSQRLSEASYDELRRIIREEEPPPPSSRLSMLGDMAATIAEHRRTDLRKLNQLVRGDLDWIVMKALEKDRTRRYETANALARDIERYLNEEPVEACPPSAGYRLQKFIQRNKTILAMTAAIATVLVLAAVVGTWQAIRATRAEGLARTRLQGATEARNDAQAAQQQAEDERDLAKHRLYDARLAQARAGRRSGQIGQRFESLKALHEATRLASELKLDKSAWMNVRNEAIACLSLLDVRLVNEWQMLDLSDRGNVFDADLEHYSTIDEDGHVVVRRIGDDKELARLAAPENIEYDTAWAAGFSPNGDLLATYSTYQGDQVSLFHVWDWRKQTIVFRAPFSDVIRQATCFSPDSRLLGIARPNGDVVLFDLSNGQELRRIETKTRPEDLAFSPDGSKLAYASDEDRQVQIWDVSTGNLLRRFSNIYAFMVSWHEDGRLLAVSSDDDYNIHIFDMNTGEEHSVLRGHQGLPHGIRFAASGNVLSSWSWDGTTRIWNPDSGDQLLRIPAVVGQLSADGRKLVCRQGRKLQLWQVTRSDVYRSLPPQASTNISMTNIYDQTISRDGRWLAVASADGVGLYDLALGTLTTFLPLAGVEAVAFHPSGQELFVGGTIGVYRLPLAIEGRVLRIGPPSILATGSKRPIEIDAQARLLVYADYNGGAAQLLQLDKPENPGRRLTHSRCLRVAISPDARWVATGTHQGRGVKVWESATGKLVKNLTPEAGNTLVGFSPDSRWLMTWDNYAISFWEVDSWKPGRQIALTGEEFARVAWAADGNMLAYTPTPYQVALQDPETGRPLAILEASDGYLSTGSILRRMAPSWSR